MYRMPGTCPVVGIGSASAPHPQASVAPPTWVQRGWATLACKVWWWGTQFRRRDINSGTLCILRRIPVRLRISFQFSCFCAKHKSRFSSLCLYKFRQSSLFKTKFYNSHGKYALNREQIYRGRQHNSTFKKSLSVRDFYLLAVLYTVQWSLSPSPPPPPHPHPLLPLPLPHPPPALCFPAFGGIIAGFLIRQSQPRGIH